MSWDEEQMKIESVINSHISWYETGAQFCEKLYKLLDESSSVDSFLDKAEKAIDEHNNPWQNEELLGMVNSIEEELLVEEEA